MPFVCAKALEGFLTLDEMQRVDKEVNDIIVAVKGETVRDGVWGAAEHVLSGAQGVGGNILEKKR